MGNESSMANAAANKSAVDETGVTGVGTSFDHEADFVKRRMAKMEQRMKAALPPAPKADEVPAEPTTEATEQGEPEAPEPVLSKSDKQEEQPTAEEKEAKRKLAPEDLDELTDEDIRELAEKGKSGLLKRIAELTAKRKAAEEQLAALKAEKQKPQEDPLKPKVDIPNPFAALDSIEKLQEKAKEIDAVIDEAEELLWNSEHLGAEDVVATYDGKEFTKSQVRAILRQNQKARKDYLPARLAQIQEAQQRKAMREQYLEQAKAELEWLAGEDNDVRKQFEVLRQSPVLTKAIKSVPELEPYLDYMVAHASNSMFNRKIIPIDSKPKVSPMPNNPPTAGAARSEQPSSRIAKSLKESEQRFKQTGSPDDFAAMRAAKFAARMK